MSKELSISLSFLKGCTLIHLKPYGLWKLKKLWCSMLSYYIRVLVQAPAALLSTQLPANVSKKPAEDGSIPGSLCGKSQQLKPDLELADWVV